MKEQNNKKKKKRQEIKAFNESFYMKKDIGKA